MLSQYRSFFFSLFVGVFFITAASVIFYAFGYRFSIDRGIFIYTGSLSLKTNVETVNVKIDDQMIPEKRLGLLNNSIQITGLTPGEHFVEVSSPTYKPWSKKIVIQSGVTTEFWNILLAEENPPLETMPATENVIRMFPAPNGLFAAVKKQGIRYSVEVFDEEGNEQEEVFSTDQAIFSPELHTNIEWSPESHKIMIPLLQDKFPFYALVNVRTKETTSLNELSGIATPLKSPRWDATTRDFLFFLSNDTLYRLDTAATTPTPILVKENVLAYEISGAYIYYLSSENGVVYQIPAGDTNFVPKQITPAPASIDTQNTYALIAYDEDRLTILEEETGELTVFNRLAKDNPLKQIQSNVKSLQYSDDGKKLLYYTDYEIFVYFNQPWEAQPIRELDSVTQVARFSSPIKNTQWAEDYEHVIFSLGNNIKIAELDYRDRRNIMDLLVTSSFPLQILSRFGENKVYIITEDTTQGIQSFNFPESVGFLGF